MNPEGTEGIFGENGRLYTLSACPGKKVYGERLVTVGGKEFREWDPYRSKLAAYIRNGGKEIPLKEDSSVVYLGASSGTTASHVADIACHGKVVCVEFSPGMFRKLVRNCEGRPSMMPVLGDATNPSGYSVFADSVDTVYQDVAQKNQADILIRNMNAFGAEWGMIAVKARCEDVTADPETIFRETEERIRSNGFRIVDSVRLEPYEKDHAMIVARRKHARHSVHGGVLRNPVPDGPQP